MKCPQCQTEVAEDASFCSRCGHRLGEAGAIGPRATGDRQQQLHQGVRFRLNAESYPDDASAQYHLGEFYRYTGRNEEAVAAYRKVLELTPTDLEALGALVRHYTDLEAWDELAAMYETALRSRQKLEDEKGMLLQLAMVHWRFRDDADAAEPFFASALGQAMAPMNAGMHSGS